MIFDVFKILVGYNIWKNIIVRILMFPAWAFLFTIVSEILLNEKELNSKKRKGIVWSLLVLLTLNILLIIWIL